MVIKLNVIRVNFTRGVVVFDSIMGTLTSPLCSAFDAIGPIYPSYDLIWKGISQYSLSYLLFSLQ